MRPMNGSEFLRKVRKIGRERNIAIRFDRQRGKGSHGVLSFGDRKAAVKDRKKEISPGLPASMLRDLGLSKGDL